MQLRIKIKLLHYHISLLPVGIKMLKGLFSKSNKNTPDNNVENSADTLNTSGTLLSSDKIKAVVADLTSANQLFKDAGFLMEQLEIEVGSVPKIIPQFKQTKEISKEEESTVLEQLVDRNMIKFVLISLFKSSKMKAMMEGTELYFYGIEIEITSAPAVKTIFKRKHSLNDALID